MQAQVNSAPMVQQPVYSAPNQQPWYSAYNPFGSTSTIPQKKPACGWTGTKSCFKKDGTWLDSNGNPGQAFTGEPGQGGYNPIPGVPGPIGGKNMSKTRRQKMLGGTAVPYSPSVWGNTSPYPAAVGGGVVEPNTPAGLAHYAAPVKQTAGSRRTRRQQQQKRQRKQKRSQKRQQQQKRQRKQKRSQKRSRK
jgi:hypothetical protein